MGNNDMRFTDNFMYTDCGEAGTLLWSLDYHFKKILSEAEGITPENLYRRPTDYLSPPGWILAHMAVKERDHIAGFAQGANDVPRKYGIFRGNPKGDLPPKEKMHEALPDVSSIISYYREVRAKTTVFLESLNDEDFKSVPGYINQDPLREFFVMTIHHQNYHWAQLRLAQRILSTR